MIPLNRYSEHFAPSGGVSARATHRALGKHSLDFWELFLRETIQNSWDARCSDVGPIYFSITAWTATPSQRSFLRDFVLTDAPPGLDLESALDDAELQFLAVTDSGTRGLSGPTRADIDPSTYSDDHTDFVDLIRDTGRRADKGYEGGTYGFGKVVLCQASRVSTVLIYTATREDTRFIAMAIGEDEYVARGARYTGRHWWGDVRGNVAEPLRGADADEAAFNLGMHKLITGATGTAIVVVAPKSPDAQGPESLQKIVEAIADAAAEYAWPHMITTSERDPSIRFSITLNGSPIPLRNPMTDPRLKTFSGAFIRCEQLAAGLTEPRDAWPWYLRVVKSQRPIKVLGSLVWCHQAMEGSSYIENDPRSQVALIRNPRFVVTYRDVPADPSGKETFGVFLAASDLDSQYAESEPPTHDAWVPKKGEHFNPARRVLKEIPELIRQRPKVDGASGNGAQTAGVVAIASALGILLDGHTSTGDPRVPWSPPDPAHRRGDVTSRSSGLGSQPSVGQPASADEGSDVSNGNEYPSRAGGALEDPELRDGSAVPTHPAPEDNLHRLGPTRPLQPPAVRFDGQPTLRMYEGNIVAEFPFVLRITQGLVAVKVSAQPSVLIDGGKETEPPLGAEMPTVLAWHDLSSGAVISGASLTITQPFSDRWSVFISQPSDTAVGVYISIEDYR